MSLLPCRTIMIMGTKIQAALSARCNHIRLFQRENRLWSNSVNHTNFHTRKITTAQSCFISPCTTSCSSRRSPLRGSHSHEYIRRNLTLESNVTSSNECNSRFVQQNVIDGKSIAREIREEIKAEIDVLSAAHPKQRKPHLSVVLVGNNPASVVYVRNKARAAVETGLSCDILRLPDIVTEAEVLEEINILNRDSSVDGVIVQLPLPSHMRERVVCDSVLPEKDVDGFNVLNVGRFCVNQKAFIPATPSGVLEIMKRLNIETCGKNALVLGRSKNVGLPIALHLQASNNGSTSAGNATTTICHRHTPPDKLRQHTQNADILISATGIPRLVTADMVKEGAVVIDIGISRVKQPNGKYRLVGDVDFKGVKEKASLITPVPGGVGPVTVAMVLKNTLVAFKKEINFYETFSASGL